MCFDICTINIRVSIRVRGLHLVLFSCPLFSLTQQSELPAKMQNKFQSDIRSGLERKKQPVRSFLIGFSDSLVNHSIPVPRILTPIVESTAGVSEASWASRVEKNRCS